MQIKSFGLLNIFGRKSLILIDDPPVFLIFRSGKNKIPIKYSDVYDIKYHTSFLFAKIVIILNNRPDIKYTEPICQGNFFYLSYSLFYFIFIIIKQFKYNFRFKFGCKLSVNFTHFNSSPYLILNCLIFNNQKRLFKL